MLLDLSASNHNTTLVGGASFLQIADVGDYTAIARVIEEALTWRPIDVLICNAGITRSGFFEDVSVEDLNAVVQTNLLGTVYPVHAALPSLKERSRSQPVAIVFIGSLASLVSSHDSSKAIFPLGSCDHRFCAHTSFSLCFSTSFCSKSSDSSTTTAQALTNWRSCENNEFNFDSSYIQ
jgi:NAD(P)-dependent dehydrogenase (short-subunit alcohol dehydrogenase family)